MTNSSINPSTTNTTTTKPTTKKPTTKNSHSSTTHNSSAPASKNLTTMQIVYIVIGVFILLCAAYIIIQIIFFSNNLRNANRY